MNQGKKKLSLEEIKSKSPKSLLNLINRAKKFLKKDPVMNKVFKEHGVSIDFLDLVPIKFGSIDVSATTSHGVITLNYKLLADGDFFKDYGYLVHEVTHYLQQCFGKKPTKGADDGDYLDNPAEQEGFQNQIKYIDHHFGEAEAKGYVNNLLDYHKVNEKEERKDKKDTLLSKI